MSEAGVVSGPKLSASVRERRGRSDALLRVLHGQRRVQQTRHAALGWREVSPREQVCSHRPGPPLQPLQLSELLCPRAAAPPPQLLVAPLLPERCVHPQIKNGLLSLDPSAGTPNRHRKE